MKPNTPIKQEERVHTRLSFVDSVRTITVIEVKSIRGKGTSQDPVEQIIEYFSEDGVRLARINWNDNPEEIHKWEEQTQ